MQTARPHGRSLGDFGQLLPAEQKLLLATARGEQCVIGEDRPEQAKAANRVRADFIRFLALGGDDANPVHERGVWLVGAWIEDAFDVSFCELSGPLQLWRCRLEQFNAQEARLNLLSLRGSFVSSGINAGSVRINGSLFMNDKFKSEGVIFLVGAYVSGDVILNGGILKNKYGIALAMDRATIKGGAFFQNKFKAIGEVRLLGAMIEGNFECDEGIFRNEGGNALFLDGACVKGSAFLRNNFFANGEVRLIDSSIGGTLDCNGGRFFNNGADALSLDRARIIGGLFLYRGYAAKGAIRLSNAQIGSLADSADSWPEIGQLIVDGLAFGHLAGGAPTSGAARVEWLKRQRPDHLTSDFRPQPWEEMIRVLRAMGHEEDAKIVAIAKQEQLRIAGRIDWRQQWRRPLSTRLADGTSARFSVLGWVLHGLWGRLAGFGYRPLRLVGWMLAVWAISSGLFWLGMKGGYMAPTSPIVITNGSIDAACDAGPDAGDRRWTLCPKLPDEYSTFQPMAYSLDLILPVVSLQQDTEWAPVVGNAVRWYWPGIGLRALLWFEILFGWISSLLLIAIFTNLVKKD